MGNAARQQGAKKPAATKSPASRRRAARLAALQALYQLEVTGMAPDAVLLEFLQHRLEDEVDGLKLGDVDRKHFGELVRGVSGARSELDAMLMAVIAEDWTVERLETLLRVLLRSGTYELGYLPSVPAKTVISEYVDLAHAFFTGREPAMANAMLDRLARTLRPEELEGE